MVKKNIRFSKRNNRKSKRRNLKKSKRNNLKKGGAREDDEELANLIDTNSNIKKIEKIIKKGANVNELAFDSDGTKEYPLIRAIEKNNVKLTELLLKNGANPNQQTDYLDPLSHAIVNMNPPNFKIIKLLVDNGANPYTRNISVFKDLEKINYGTPVFYATKMFNEEKSTPQKNLYEKIVKLLK